MRIAVRRLRDRLDWVDYGRWCITAIPILLVVWLAGRFFILGSSATYTFHPKQPGLIQIEDPRSVAGRIATGDQLRWYLDDDATAWSFSMPRITDQVQVRFRLADIQQDTILLTAFGSVTNFQTLEYSRWLNDINWPRVSTSPLTLWQRPGVQQYSSVADFLQHGPAERTVVMGLDRYMLSQPAALKAQRTLQPLGANIRGSHTAYFTSDGRTPWRLQFRLLDLNRRIGADQLMLSVSPVSRIQTTSTSGSWHRIWRDDGNTTNDRSTSHAKMADIEEVLPAGMYSVSIVASDDVVMTDIATTATDWSYSGTITLAGGSHYYLPGPTAYLATTGRSIEIQTTHDEGLQTIRIAGREVKVDRVKTPVRRDNFTGQTAVVIPRPDVVVTSDGLMVFAGFDSIAAQSARSIGLDERISTDDADYILAVYTVPTGKITEIQRTYRIRDLNVANAAIRWQIETPGLRSNRGMVELERLQATLQRDTAGWRRILHKLWR